MAADPLLTSIMMIAMVQNFSETLGQVRRSDNFRQEQNRAARIFVLRDGQKRALESRIGRELFGAGKKPGINLCVNGAQFGLKPRRVAFRVIHQKSRVNAEETS